MFFTAGPAAASGIARERVVKDSVGALELLRHEGREDATTPEVIRAARDHLETAGLLPAPLAQKPRTSGQEAPR